MSYSTFKDVMHEMRATIYAIGMFAVHLSMSLTFLALTWAIVIIMGIK